MQYKIMPSRFASHCNETKTRIAKGETIFYVPDEKRAYSSTSQKAAWLKENGTIITIQPRVPAVRPATVHQTLAPAMASVFTTAAPKRAVRPVVRPVVHHVDGGTVVFYPKP